MKEFDEEFSIETQDIEMDLMDIRESAKIKNVINKLSLYKNNPEELTNIYTSVLQDDNVAFIITKISQNKIFLEQFPEFYIKNEYEENVINCQQNSSYHKYGVFKHILSTVESVGNPQIPIGDLQKKILKWTMFLHDIGKPYVKVIAADGTESFAGHDDKSVELATEILNRFYFTQEEKKIILTLIKYHDKFLNEGEITYDNMKFLANELDNNKELFYLLIDVKDSDARAKSLEVYNKYKLTKNKYIEFINSYFEYNEENVNGESEGEIENVNIEEITDAELSNLLSCVTTRKKMSSSYQPVIDLKINKVFGYEVFTKLDSSKKINITEFLNYAKEYDKYDKAQQIMLINCIESFEKIENKESNILFVNSDLNSYNKYINKPRIYDMMNKNKIIIEFHNYEKKDLSMMQNVFEIIHKNNGYVALDHFGIGTLTINDIGFLNIDYIIPDISLIQNIKEDEQKQKYLSELVTYAISKNCNVLVVGIEDKETLNVVKEIGVRYVQGYYFESPNKFLGNFNGKLNSILKANLDDNISK